MRDIKFRAWDGVSFVRWNVLDDFNDHAYYRSLEAIGDTNTKIMQYTGLTDKNGVEIYEGDIVKYDSGIERGVGDVRPIHNTCNLAFWWITQTTSKPSTYSEVSYFGCAQELEVIGNIHENPELLEDKDDG